jgi:hypothetical protein
LIVLAESAAAVLTLTILGELLGVCCERDRLWSLCAKRNHSAVC